MARKEIDYSKWSKEQLNVARMLADPDCHMTMKEVAAACGISDRTVYRYKENADFIELVNNLAEMHMDMFLSTLYKQLQKRILKGSDKAIELGLKRAGVMIERREVVGEMTFEVQPLDGKTNEQILREIEELEKKALPSPIDEDDSL
jgi:AcrR family transcriptional regulator